MMNKHEIEEARKETARDILSDIRDFADRSLKRGCIEDIDFEYLCIRIAQRYKVEVEE